MTVFKLNDKIECINPGNEYLTKGKVYTVTGATEYWVLANSDRGNDCWYDPTRFKLYEEKAMKKSDLKSGMHVELRNGHTYMVLTDGYYGGFCLILIGAVGWASDAWDEDMTCQESKNLDVMKVHTAPIYNVMEISNQRKLVWEREEQTPEQKQLQQVLIKISELQDHADNLKELINK